MPSSNGVYSLPPGYLAVTGATIQASQHNPPLEDIAAALTARLSRDGTAAMTGPLQATPGAVGLPGVVFSSDTTTGFYKTTSGIGVAVAGTKIAEFTAGGIVGTRLLGELVPYTGSAVPSALWVFPNGQTLSRTAYPTLWAFAQVEIAAGNTLYNNGNGSTTFGIMDMRGRVSAGFDAGNSTGRLNTGGLNAATLGTAGGEQQHILVAPEIPSITSTVTSPLSVSATSGNYVAQNAGSNALTSTGGSGIGGAVAISGALVNFVTVNGTATGGAITSNNTAGGAHNNIQPTIVTNYLLFAGN